MEKIRENKTTLRDTLVKRALEMILDSVIIEGEERKCKKKKERIEKASEKKLELRD